MILIDSRAGSVNLASQAPLSRMSTLTELDSGDVCIAGNGPNRQMLIGIEYKSLFDLVASAKTGRLQATQIRRMIRDYDVIFLLYYGIYRPNPSTGILEHRKYSKRSKKTVWVPYKYGAKPLPCSYVEKFLFDLSFIGVHIKHIPCNNNKYATPNSPKREADKIAAKWISYLAEWSSKDWEDHKAMHTFDNSYRRSLLPSVPSHIRACAEVAASLPTRIGYTRGLNAARHFGGSIYDMVCAGESEWRKIDGIGPVLSKAVVEKIRERRKP